MSKVWLIARHHFAQETSKRTFLLVLFSLPLFLALSIGMGYLASRLNEKKVTLGYVDQAGLLRQAPAVSDRDPIQLMPFASPGAARTALEAGEIDAYYVLAADYRVTRRAELVYVEMPAYRARQIFRQFVQRNLLSDQPATVVERVLDGATVTVQATERNRTYPAGGPNAGQFAPLVVAAFFVFLVLTTSGYMMEVIVAEKENRTIEVVVTSVSPGQMMAGKIVGGVGISLTQLAVWLVCLILAVWAGRGPLGIEWLRDIQLDWRDVGMMVLVALPCYIALAALMTLMGTTIIDSQEAQQAGGLLFLPLLLPLYLIIVIARNLDGPLSLGFSLFPVTSVMTLAIRSLFTQVPAWQFVVSAVVASVSAAAMIWLAGRAFRATMLRYGRRLQWRDLASARAARPKSAHPIQG